MVNSKLHIICGNCGSNDDMKYEVERDDVYKDQKLVSTAHNVFMSCENCGTLHSLDDFIDEK